MPRSDFKYNQLGIGDCGHVVHTWPQVSSIGGKELLVICDECSPGKWGLSAAEIADVWVYLKSSEIKPSPVKPKPKRVKKEKPLTKWETLLRQEGLF